MGDRVHGGDPPPRGRVGGQGPLRTSTPRGRMGDRVHGERSPPRGRGTGDRVHGGRSPPEARRGTGSTPEIRGAGWVTGSMAVGAYNPQGVGWGTGSTAGVHPTGVGQGRPQGHPPLEAGLPQSWKPATWSLLSKSVTFSFQDCSVHGVLAYVALGVALVTRYDLEVGRRARLRHYSLSAESCSPVRASHALLSQTPFER